MGIDNTGRTWGWSHSSEPFFATLAERGYATILNCPLFAFYTSALQHISFGGLLGRKRSQLVSCWRVLEEMVDPSLAWGLLFRGWIHFRRVFCPGSFIKSQESCFRHVILNRICNHQRLAKPTCASHVDAHCFMFVYILSFLVWPTIDLTTVFCTAQAFIYLTTRIGVQKPRVNRIPWNTTYSIYTLAFQDRFEYNWAGFVGLKNP